MKFYSNRLKIEHDNQVSVTKLLHQITEAVWLGKASNDLIENLKTVVKSIETARTEPHTTDCLICHKHIEIAPDNSNIALIHCERIIKPDQTVVQGFPIVPRYLVICKGCYDKHEVDTYLDKR